MVKIRQRGARIQYDICFRWPDGTEYRERRNAPVASKSGAKRWAEAREAALLAAGKPAPVVKPTTTPTLESFWPRVVSDWYEANRKKHSTRETAKSIYKTHLAPALGGHALDAIDNSAVATLKGRLAGHGPKTVNNVLSVLSRTLKCAIEWGVIEGPLPKFGLLSVTSNEAAFYEVDVYRRLVDAARAQGRRRLVLVLLAGSAGLRRGEIMALRWHHVDFPRRQLRIEVAEYGGHGGTTKGGRSRVVPMTEELHAALTAHKHLVGDRVLYNDDNHPLTNRTVRNWMAAVQRRAGAEATGEIHILRHTYGSHLAMAGVPAKVIQELMGHADLKTTLRYLHLASRSRNDATEILERFYESGPEQQACRSVSQQDRRPRHA